MQRERSLYESIDWLSIFLYALLVVFGWINIYAAVYNEEHISIFDTSQRYGKQMIWIALSLLLAVIILIVDSRFYSIFSYPIYLITILLLIAVLIFGKSVSGARSWFDLGFFRFQPAEFAKFATGLALAHFLSSYNFKIHKLKNLLTLALITFLPAILIILQNDTGSALVYIAFVIVFYREGLNGTVLLLGVALVALFVAVLLVEMLALFLFLLFFAALIFYFADKNLKNTLKALLIFSVAAIFIGGVAFLFSFEISYHFIILLALIISTPVYFYWAYLKRLNLVFYIHIALILALSYSYSVNYIFTEVLVKHQRTRINVLLNIEDDIRGAGYNVHQSKIAIGSGGLSGKGFLEGTQTKLDYVPEQSTDFIFCTIGEEWGFWGASATLLVFLFLLLRIVQLAEKQTSTFSRVYGYSVAVILFFHLAINVGMTLGLAPVIGIPLPFFSYGGSSLWAFTILLFIFIRLDTNREKLF